MPSRSSVPDLPFPLRTSMTPARVVFTPVARAAFGKGDVG
jgi:hypothetical protein